MASKKERPATMPRHYKKDTQDLQDVEPSLFAVPVPNPLPAGYATSRAWIDDLFPRHSVFTTPDGGRYTVMRNIPISAQDVVVVFNILCND